MELPSLLGTVFVIFFTGLSGIVFNYKNFLVTLMCVEAMYLGAVSSFAIYGATFRDPSAAINALLVLIFGACESAIGLGLLVAAYRFVHRIDFLRFMMIGG
jgi:NADH:ubiquinone oxidoreductase subunit K